MMEWASQTPPRVLLLGNGLLRLKSGIGWLELLKKMNKQEKPISDAMLKDQIPCSMWVEALYGCDAEENRRLAAEVISGEELRKSDLLKKLLQLPWDCILTTNYSYEIEDILTDGRWSSVKTLRSRSLRCLDGNPRKHDNFCICYEVKTAAGRTVPVWHVHGDYARRDSMILTYYSYANQINRMLTYNKSRGNCTAEAQQQGKPISMNSWLDWYVLGDVYSVGFGFDLSEFDLWWATERKVREVAAHGGLHYYTEEKNRHSRESIMLESVISKPLLFSEEGGYPTYYRSVVDDIRAKLLTTDVSAREA